MCKRTLHGTRLPRTERLQTAIIGLHGEASLGRVRKRKKIVDALLTVAQNNGYNLII
jgi:hypothetical protein